MPYDRSTKILTKYVLLTSGSDEASWLTMKETPEELLPFVKKNPHYVIQVWRFHRKVHGDQIISKENWNGR